MNRLSPRRRAAGFLLLETLIGVAIFALGVLALARCVEHCLEAESAKVWDERARVALENRMAEIEAGAAGLDAEKDEPLGGMFEGITLRQRSSPLRWREGNREIQGLFQVQLEARWQEAASKQSKVLAFYVFPQR
ncbi:MAG: hypothetical protein WCH57_06065 [Verrucomicrobiota bacterium]